MKTIMAVFFGTILTVGAVKNYQYKDISPTAARPLPEETSRSSGDKSELRARLQSARETVKQDEEKIQKQEARLKEDRALVRDLEERLESTPE